MPERLPDDVLGDITPMLRDARSLLGRVRLRVVAGVGLHGGPGMDEVIEASNLLDEARDLFAGVRTPRETPSASPEEIERLLHGIDVVRPMAEVRPTPASPRAP